MMRAVILVCGLLMAPLVQAEKLSEAQVKSLEPTVRANCEGADVVKRALPPAEFAEVCDCTVSRFSVSLRSLEFASLNRPTESELRQFRDIEKRSAEQCALPFIKKKVVTDTVPVCVGVADKLPPLQGKGEAEVKEACSCAASKVAGEADFIALGAMPDKKAASEKSARMFLAAVESCTAK